MANPTYIWKQSGSTEWSCDCPDFTKTEPAHPRSRFPALKVNRDWTSSDAGASNDCKHIMNVKIQEGEDQSDMRDDYPLPVKTGLDERTEKVYRIPRGNGNSGDNFSFGKLRGWD